MAEPKTLHIWMHDGRSLCDRRALTPTEVGAMADEEFEAHLREQTEAPACGSCLLVAGNMRHQAAVLLRRTNGYVHPKKPREALGSVVGYAVGTRVQPGGVSVEAEVDEIEYQRINYEVDPARIDEAVAEWSDYEAKLRAYRDKVLAASTTEPGG